MAHVALFSVAAPVPVPSASSSCTGLGGQFFVRFEGSIIHAFGGGVDIWNNTGFIASDSKTSRLRLDSQAQARELSSGPSFTTESSSLFLNGESSYSVADGSCSANTTKASSWDDACVGSIARFMPLRTLSEWETGTDKWLGYDTLDGVNVSVWGWDHADPGRPANAKHRLYLLAETDPGAGRPLLETQGQHLAESYPVNAMVRFSTFETILGSDFIFGYPGSGGLFSPPLPCQFQQAQWDPTTGKPPYDDTAYKCTGSQFKVVKAVMHLTTDEDAFYTWPSLPGSPPKAAVTQVPHEGGPGPQIVCFAEKL